MISIIIPCHNEQAVLPQVFTRLSAAAPTWGEDYEALLIDDGSTDGTWEQIQRFHQLDRRWKGVRLARNFGQQAALGAGLCLARGDAVAIIDADLQDPPELIAEFLERWRRGAEVVYGIRRERPEGWLKRICYTGFYWLLARSSQVPIPPDAGDFGLLDRRVVRALRACREQSPFWRGLRAYVGFRQVGVPYARYSRQAGQARYTLRKLLRLASDGFWSVTTFPLDVLTGAAVLATLLVVLCGAHLVSSERLGLGTWAALMLGAVNLLGMALLGRYQARLLAEVRRRPRWIIAQCLGLAAGAGQTRGGRRSRAAARVQVQA
jgi:glycosyltransferase involved in cell wall biosynthesis